MPNEYESENGRDGNELESDRYAAFSDGTGEVVVYDTRNDDAWLRADCAVAIEEMT